MLLFLLAAFCGTALASGFKCRDVTVKSLSVGQTKKAQLCFLEKDSYFITGNCSTLECDLVNKLRKTKFTSSVKERPGSTLCKSIGGAVDSVEISGIKGKDQACVLPKSESSISLNLLESWDGKFFTGPAKSVEF